MRSVIFLQVWIWLLPLGAAFSAAASRPGGEGDFTRVDLASLERFPAVGMKVGEPGFDAMGHAFDPAEFMEAASAQAPHAGLGSAVGVPFLASTDAGLHLLAEKQTVPVQSDAACFRIHFLGASGYGPAVGNVELVTTSGVQVSRLRLSDWRATPGFGEAVAVRFSHTLDDGQRTEKAACLFVQTIPLAAPAKLTAIRLPMNPDLRIFAITLDHRPSGTPAGELIEPEVATSAPAIDLPQRMPRKADGPDVGFVVHPHEPHFADYTAGEARTMLSNAFCWRVLDVETGRFDDAFPTRNLQYCYEHDLTMAPIIDNSLMLGGSAWFGRYARMKGEGIISAEGRSWTWPSPYSPIYRRETQRYAEQVTRWVNANDPDRRVTAYVNGAEWFWQGSFDYSTPTIAAFRRRMQERYASIERLNASWGTSYASFEQADPPRLFVSGSTGSRPATFTVGPSWNDTSWALPMDQAIACEAGQTFAAELTFHVESMLPNHVDLEGVWLDAANKVIGWQPTEIQPTEVPGRYRVTWQDAAPAKARRLWPHLKTKGPGTVRFEHLSVRRTEPEAKLVLDDDFTRAADRGWQFTVWTGPGRGEVIPASSDRAAALQTSVPSAAPAYGNTTAAVVDYVEFTWEALADAINDQAAVIKRCDASRPVAGYLGFAWALPVVWDNAITNHAIDVTAVRAQALDIFGMQLCSARGDFHYATSTIDVARKYGKPMWATDLIDFTHGTYVGFETLDQLTQGCIQHGLDGVFWYCWFGTPDYNYYTGLPDEKVRELVHNAEDSIRELQGSAPVVRVALVNPIIPYWLGDPDGMKNDAFDAYGWQKLLGEMGLAVDLWTPYELEHASTDALAKYRAVVLPDAAFMPGAAIEKIRRFAADGGGLVCSGRMPIWDSHGSPLLDVLPADASGALRFDGAVGRAYLGTLKRFRVAGNTPPLFIEVDDRDKARANGRATQARVRAYFQSRGIPLVLGPEEHRVEVSVHEKAGETTLFLLRGETQPAPLTGVRVELAASRAEVKVDHGPWRPALIHDGYTTVPEFRNICLVRYAE